MSFSRRKFVAIAGLASDAFCLHDLYFIPAGAEAFRRDNDIVRFDPPATINAAYLHDLKDDFEVLYAEAATRRRMMSISTHDRISGIPGRVKLLEDFIKYAQKQKNVGFMRKDEIAKWALSAANVPHET